MPKKTEKKTIAKSAKSGKIVSKDFAKQNPDTTFETVVDAPETSTPILVDDPPILPADEGEGPKEKWLPAIDEVCKLTYRRPDPGINTFLQPGIGGNTFTMPVPMFADIDQYVARVQSYDPLIIYVSRVQNGVRVDTVLDENGRTPALHDCLFSPITKDEAFRMLA